jgi:hypothetical protein
MSQIQSILCPVDFSEFSAHAYEYAESLAWHYKLSSLPAVGVRGRGVSDAAVFGSTTYRVVQFGP